MRKNKGITLIALVITIIVLLILAGVAIAMLSGENGILRKAAEAKTKTEGAQKQEEARLTDMEITTEFLTNNIKYKCGNGYITGFEVGETVEEIEKTLNPLGYKINLKYDIEEEKDVSIEESEKKDLKIATGMSVQKDGKTIARTILYGDVNGDGKINYNDRNDIDSYMFFQQDFAQDFSKIACDVNNDKEIDNTDTKMINDYEAKKGEIEQNRIAGDVKNIGRLYKYLQQYIKLLDESTGYKFEYDNETDTYKLKGVKEGTTVETLISKLPNSSELVIYDQDENDISGSEAVKDGYKLERTFNDENEQEVTALFATIEIEK